MASDILEGAEDAGKVSSGITITGAAALEHFLTMLPKALAGKLAKKALRIGGRPILDEARANTPVRSGTLRKSLSIFVGKNRSKTERSILIGGRISYKKFKGVLESLTKKQTRLLRKTKKGILQIRDPFYLQFVEFDKKTGSRKSTNRKLVPGKHIVEKAFAAKGTAGLHLMLETLKAELDKLNARNVDNAV